MKTSGTGGAYQGGGNPDYVVRELYKCPNVRTELTDVFINAGVQRAFRAPGHPQGAWALEQTMDAAGREARNGPGRVPAEEPHTESVRPARTSRTRRTGFADCLREGAQGVRLGRGPQTRPPEPVPVRRGVGIAGGMWQGGNGGPPATILVKVFADG